MSTTNKDSVFTRGFSYPTIQNGPNGSGLNLIEAKVQSYDYKSGFYQCFGKNAPITCINTSSILSSLLGLKINTVLEVGTPVLVLQNTRDSNISYILGTIGLGNTTPEMYKNDYLGVDPKSNVLGNLLDDAALENPNTSDTVDGSSPSNLAPGEAVIQNASGVALQLLSYLATLKASDLAKIECLVQDDMVRILSKTYQNLNALGEYTIFNENGNLNVVWKGTNKEFESFNLENENESLGKVENNKVNDIDQINEDTFTEDGRWRFSSYIGRLGNFIHLFISDPTRILENSNTNCAAGRANLHVNEDGSVLVQSISDIAFEKVVRIPVPTETKAWDETTANDTFDPSAMKNWTTMGDEELWQMSYKLADYGRWFSQIYCNSGFIGNKRFNKISEVTMDDVDPFAKDKERESVDANFEKDFQESQLAYSTIRIFKDGSIVLMDAYGSSIHLSGGFVTIKSPKDFNIQAAGTLNLTANDIAITSRNSTTISSTEGTTDVVGKVLARLSSTEGFAVVESTMKNAEVVKASDNATVNALVEKAKEVGGENSYPNVIISATSKDGTIGIYAFKNIFLETQNFIVKTFKTIINCFTSLYIPRVLSWFMGKDSRLSFLSPKICTEYRIESKQGFSTSSSRTINTMLGPWANATNAAVEFDSDLDTKNTETKDLLPEGYVEDDIKVSFPKSIPSFDYPDYDVSQKDIFQNLTDQYIENRDDINDDYIAINNNNINIGGNVKKAPYPGKGILMKKYKPRSSWDFSKAQDTPENAQPQQFTKSMYTTFYKKLMGDY